MSSLAEKNCSELALTNPGPTLRLNISPGLQVTGDADLLQVALENLFGNACKYTEGKVEVHISLSAKLQDGNLTFAVVDNGTGFDMAETEKLFRSFQSLSSASSLP